MSRFHCITALLFTCLLPGLAAGATVIQSVKVSLSTAPSSVQAGSPVSLTAAVQPQGGASTIPARPTGSITFFDGSTPLNSGALQITPQSGFASATFQQAVGIVDASLAGISRGEISADLNGDGAPDLLIYGQQTNSSPIIVQTFTSNGTTTYTANATQALNFPAFEAYHVSAVPVFMDVNDDGRQDILYGIAVAYGNGDGTFQQPTALSFLANDFAASYAADVNSDGKIDIIAVNTPPWLKSSNSPPFRITVFINGGSGTFTSAGTFSISQLSSSDPGVVYGVNQLRFADVNGDAKIDLIAPTATQAAGNIDIASVGVLLNNGDGTFGSPQHLNVPTAPNGDYNSGAYLIEAADLNADGKLDLVLSFNSSFAQSDAAFFPGNGDGTFGAPVFIPVNLGPPHQSSLSALPNFLIYDVNLDGRPDIVFGDGEVVINNGNGSFNVGNSLFPLESSNFNYLTFPLISMLLPQNSVPSLIFLDLGSGAPANNTPPAVFTPLTGSSARISVTTLTPGEHALTAQYSGDANYSAVTSIEQTVTVSQASSSTNLISSANPGYTSQNVTFTASVSSSGPSPSGTVTFSSGPNVLDVATLSGGTASYTTSITTAGSYIINASYSGDANDQSSSGSLTQVVTAPLALQTGSGGSTTLTVKSGQSVATPLSIVSAAGFSGTLTFSCSGLPANAACSFSPASVALTPGTPASTTLTVSTGVSNTASLVHDAIPKNLERGLCSFGLTSLLLLWCPRKRPVALRAMLCGAIAVVFFGISGCGSGPKTQAGPSTTTPGAYTFTVSATSTNTTATSTYSLVVQ
jgi:hypothetical protein